MDKTAHHHGCSQTAESCHDCNQKLVAARNLKKYGKLNNKNVQGKVVNTFKTNNF